MKITINFCYFLLLKNTRITVLAITQTIQKMLKFSSRTNLRIFKIFTKVLTKKSKKHQSD